MFCWKCGKVIEDGEELCQDCRQQDSTVIEQWLQKGGQWLKKEGGDILDSSIEEFQKAVQKKTRQMTRKGMKKVGLMEKTPLDKAKDMWKKVKR